MQAIVLVAALIGSVVSVPAKLDHFQSTRFGGYNYNPPAQPSGLYELPDTTTTTTTTTTPPPPPQNYYLPPADSYLPPVATNQYFVQEPAPVPHKPEMLMPYNFQYGVDDDESGNKYSHTEDSDGRHVKGQYSVLLPDGRTQIVTFSSSPETGYLAEVTYV